MRRVFGSFKWLPRIATVVPERDRSFGAILSVSYDFHLGNHDNGNVYQIINGRDGTRTQNFTYDALNRIQQAWTSGANWGERFTIDPWGNLTNRYENLAAPTLTNNQLSGGYIYDAAGNMTTNNGINYTYDAENRLLTSGGVTYTYDGDGNRVKKSNGTLYWGAGPLAESDLSGAVQREYTYFNGGRVARLDLSNSSVHYYFSNHLASTSVVTNATGSTPFDEDIDYYPYGGEVASSLENVAQNYKFNGKERDAESCSAGACLDNFGARFDASSLGRWMTPDWAVKPTAVPYAHYGNPQSLNLYSYVQNNPTTLGDPDGHIAGVDDLAEVAAAAVVVVGTAAVIYTSQPANQRSMARALDQATDKVANAVRGAFAHPNHAGKVAPVPGTVPTNAPAAVPGKATTSVAAGTPPSTSQAGTVNTSATPLIIVSPGGDAIPVPNGASGPIPADNGKGVQYTGGSGGYGMDPRVSDVRIMDPVPARGNAPAQPNGYVSYGNANGQSVNPQTGQTVPNSAHRIPLSPPKSCPQGSSCP